MEQSPTSSLFSLNIDPVTKAHLTEVARWARFLAIVGMIFLALLVIFGIYFTTIMSSTMSRFDNYGGGRTIGSSFGVGMAIGYVLIAILWFFPCMYLLRFANKMKRSLVANDQQAMNTSFQNLKICFRFVGIVTIIILVLYGIAILFGVLGATAFS
jgi:flagellar biogenesis protein FliO